jgi:hypothetical protein
MANKVRRKEEVREKRTKGYSTADARLSSKDKERRSGEDKTSV